MTRPRVCLICNGLLEPTWRFCFKCGSRTDDEAFDEIRSIDFILNEIKIWRQQMLINYSVEQKLIKNYEERKKNILNSLVPAPPELEVELPDSMIEDSAPQPPLQAEPAAQIAHEPPPIRRAPAEIAPQPAIFKEAAPPEPVQPQRSFAELVTENIRLIFVVSSMLFVGGVVLYYRNEIYHGLKQPIVQAVLLAIATIGSLAVGWTLVRRTSETLAGRALTLIGSLLVPINPWFLVRSHLIPNTGNAWIVGAVCTALYAWTVYFLREKIFVYIAAAAGMITACAVIYKVNGSASASIYPLALTFCSIAYLLMERIFKPKGEGIEFSREEYGQPLFHTAQVGVALSLLFYTPLITLLPEEFVAAKEYFDPKSYNSLVTFGLAVSGIFFYFYSSLIKRKSYFVYLTIGMLFWAEIALFDKLDLAVETAALAFAVTGLIMAALAHSETIPEFFAKPTEISANVVGSLISVFAVLTAMMIADYGGLTFQWSIIAAAAATSLIFWVNLIKTGERIHFYPASFVMTTALFLFLKKIGLSPHVIAPLMLLPAYLSLFLSGQMKTKASRYSFLTDDFKFYSIILACAAMYGCLSAFDALEDHPKAVALLCLEFALIFAWASQIAEERASSIIGFFVSGLFLTASYGYLLYILRNRLDEEYLIVSFALWALGLYAATLVEPIRAEMKKSFAALSTLLASLVFLASTVLVISLNFQYPSDTKLKIAVIIGLFLLLVKEALHLYKSRSAVHSTFSGLIGISLSAAFLRTAHIEDEPLLLFYVWLAVIYIAFSYFLRRRYIEKTVYLPFEILANILTVTAVLCTMGLQIDSYLDSFILTAFFITLSSAVFYVFAALLAENSSLSKIYSYCAPSVLLVSLCVLANHYGAMNWADLSGMLIPFLILYLLADKLLDETVFKGSVFVVAQVALPLVAALGIFSSIDRRVPHLSGAVFFFEISAFYLLTAGIKQRDLPIYPGLAALSFALLKTLLHLDIASGYFAGYFAVFGLILLILSLKVEASRIDWTKQALSNFAHTIFILSTAAAASLSFYSLELRNAELNPMIASLLAIIAVGALSSILIKDESGRLYYRRAVFSIACFTYLVIGVRLGYEFARQNEFYSIPIGAALLLAGYLGTRRLSDPASRAWLWLGSLLWTAPLLLHTMQYRFVTQEPSTMHDIGLIALSLALLLGGMLLQLKAPAVVGGSGFLIGLLVIVFSYVEWEQKWLSITMIALAVITFSASWIILYFHKRNKLVQLREQGKQAFEEFGRWK